jgi:hypothetical protein
MKEISVNGRSKLVPQSLEELSQEELLKLIRFVSEGKDAHYIKLQFVCDYWKIPINRINRLGRRLEKCNDLLQKVALNDQHMDILSKLYLLTEQFNFLVKDRKLTKNPVPRIRFPWLRFIRPLVGPADGLKNLTIWEFAVAERMLENYVATDEESYLDELIAILFRPVNPLRWIRKRFTWIPDTRVAFNDQTYKQRLPLIAKYATIEEKVGVAMFFHSVRDGFREDDRFPHIYNTGKKKKGGKGLSWGDVIMEMSGEIPGNEDKTAQVNLYTFLYRLELNAIKAEKMEEELEKIKQK